MARVVALVGVLVFGFIALHGVAAHYDQTVTNSQPQITVENESFVVTHDTTHAFDDSNRDAVYNDTAVEVYQNGSQVAASSGDNWRWNAGNGTLYVPSGSELTDGDDASITYRYTEPTGEQKAVRDIALVPFQLGEGIGILVGAALLLLAVSLLGRQR